MSRYSIAGVAVLASFVLSGCLASLSPKESGKPAWIDNPGNGVSASAAMHVRGKAAQEELAILRARQEYAKRFGVNIQAAQSTSTSVANGRANTVGSGVVLEDTNQTDVRGMVKEKWRDVDNDVLWVWLVPSN